MPMVDIGPVLMILLACASNLSQQFPLGRFARPAGGLLLLAAIVLFSLWIAKIFRGSAMMLAVPMPQLAGNLLYLACGMLVLYLSGRTVAAHLRAKKAAGQPQ